MATADSPAFSLKHFDELTTQEWFDISQERVRVFVVEQQCPYQEIDDIDRQCFHLQGMVGEKLAVYARILPPILTSFQGKNLPAIGRVLTVKDFRGFGFGRILMLQAIDFCQKHYPNLPIYISAQVYLSAFYQSLGFVAQGEMYLEDDIPHVDMILGDDF